MPADRAAWTECFVVQYGKLRGRVLTFSNPMRMPILPERMCTGDSLVKTFQLPLQQYLEPAELKRMDYEVVKGVTEMCGFFDPGRSNTDPIVDAFL